MEIPIVNGALAPIGKPDNSAFKIKKAMGSNKIVNPGSLTTIQNRSALVKPYQLQSDKR